MADRHCVALARHFLRDYNFRLSSYERLEEVERLAEMFEQVARMALENLPRKDER